MLYFCFPKFEHTSLKGPFLENTSKMPDKMLTNKHVDKINVSYSFEKGKNILCYRSQ